MGFRPPMDNLGDLTVDNLTVNNQFTFENLAAGNVQVDGDIEVNDGFVTVNGDTQLATLIAHRTGGLATSIYAGTLATGIAFQTGGAGFTFTAEPQANILNGSISPNFPVLELGKAGANTFLGLDFVVETDNATDAFFMDYSADTAEFNVPLAVQGADAQIFEVLTSGGTRVFSVDTSGPANVVVENIDFRVNTDNISDALFVDYSEDLVLFGDTTKTSSTLAVDLPNSQVLISDGSIAAPSFAFSNLTGAGFAKTGASAFSLVNSNKSFLEFKIGALVVNTGGLSSVDFAVETLNNEAAINVDASEDLVSFGGTNAASSTLAIDVNTDEIFISGPRLRAIAVTPDTTTVAAYQFAESGVGSDTYRPLFAGTSSGSIPDGESGYPINGLMGVSTGADKGLYINYGETNNAEFRRIMVEAQGADVASATDLSISSPYAAFEVTGTTNIESIPVGDIQNGRIITLVFAGSLDVVHNASPVAGGSAAIITKSGSNVSVTTDDVIRLQLLERGGTQKWYEI